MNITRRSLFRALGACSGAALLGAEGCRREPPGEEGAGQSPAPSERAGATQGGRPLRVVMSAAFVSESGVAVYEQICQFLARRLSMGHEFVTGLAYSTINGMLESGAVDCGFICGLPYVLLRDRPEPAVELLAAPVMRAPRYQRKPKYYSDLIVRKDSPHRTLEDLKGATYVFNEELSNSGYNMPRHRLLSLGLTQGYFGKVLRSGSHEESIRMVADGRADASYVDSLVLDYDREKGLGRAADVRVVESLGPAGICPVVTSIKLPQELRSRIRRSLTTMHEDPEGRRILDGAFVERFTEVDDQNYDDIRSMKEAAEKAGFLAIR